jgi:cyanoexosortase A
VISSFFSRTETQTLDIQHWVLKGLYGSLVLLHLGMIYRISSQIDELLVVGLFWVMLCQRLKTYQQTKQDQTHLLSSLVAFGLIACLVFRSFSLYWFDPTFLNVMPFLIVSAFALLTIGWRIWSFSIELLFCITLVIPVDLLFSWLEKGPGLPVQILTARISSFLLYYLGLPVFSQGTIIQLPQGSVNVQLACTSLSVLFSLSQIGFLLVLMWPLSRRALLWVFSLTFGLTQLVSVLRVALLAILVDQPSLFDFWHDDQGQQLLSTFLILCLGLTYYAFYLKEPDPAQPLNPQS